MFAYKGKHMRERKQVNKSEQFAHKVRSLTQLFAAGSVHTIGIDKYDYVPAKADSTPGASLSDYVDDGLGISESASQTIGRLFGYKKFLGTEPTECVVIGSSLEMRNILSRKRKWFVFVVSFKETATDKVHKQEFDIIL